jgi:hypothetical protein
LALKNRNVGTKNAIITNNNPAKTNTCIKAFGTIIAMSSGGIIVMPHINIRVWQPCERCA